MYHSTRKTGSLHKRRRLFPTHSTTNNAYRRQELDLNRTAQEFIDPLTGVFSCLESFSTYP
ncbi:hypothetical protein FE378_02720 [Corynebacterium diphtheriae]|nr:hypothetical protein FE378_02720 [Corynebacterium diphtheriae]